jgi:protein SCO1/2
MIQSNKYSSLIALLLLLIGCKPSPQPLGLPFISKPDFTPEWIEKTDARYDSIHQIPSFQFQDQDGQLITEQTVSGKIYIANFIFTSCGSICPRMTENMSIVQKKYLQDKDVLILSHSVMPDRDSVSVLKNYANNKGIVSGKWFLLTGNIDSIYRMAKKEYYAGEKIGYYGNQKDFLHTENCMLLDKHRRIRGIYNGTLPLEMERMIEDIEILKKEVD